MDTGKNRIYIKHFSFANMTLSVLIGDYSELFAVKCGAERRRSYLKKAVNK